MRKDSNIVVAATVSLLALIVLYVAFVLSGAENSLIAAAEIVLALLTFSLTLYVLRAKNLGLTAAKVLFAGLLLASMLYAAYWWHGFDQNYGIIPAKIPLLNWDFPFIQQDYAGKFSARDNILIPTDFLPEYIVPIRESTYVLVPEVPYFSGCWMGVQVTAGELEACDWIKAHTSQTDKFVDDIPGAELIMGMTTRVSTVGGDWANAPNASRDMYYNSEIYRFDETLRDELAVAKNNQAMGEAEKAAEIARITIRLDQETARAHELARTMNATYLVCPNRFVNAGAYDGSTSKEKFDNPTYFQQVYGNSDVTIYRVLP